MCPLCPGFGSALGRGALVGEFSQQLTRLSPKRSLIERFNRHSVNLLGTTASLPTRAPPLQEKTTGTTTSSATYEGTGDQRYGSGQSIINGGTQPLRGRSSQFLNRSISTVARHLRSHRCAWLLTYWRLLFGSCFS